MVINDVFREKCIGIWSPAGVNLTDGRLCVCVWGWMGTRQREPISRRAPLLLILNWLKTHTLTHSQLVIWKSEPRDMVMKEATFPVSVCVCNSQ